MTAELRTINAAGEPEEILPDWSDLTFSQDFDFGSLTFKYPHDGTNANLLTHGKQLVVLTDGFEPLDARFTYYETSGSGVAESDPADTYACKSNRSRFSQLMMAPAFGSTVADPDIFSWTNQTAGAMFKAAVDNAMSRANARASGTANPKDWFTHPIPAALTTTDSSGAAWVDQYDRKWDPGSYVSDVVQWLSDRGFAEITMQGRDVRLYKPGNRGADLTVGADPTYLVTGVDFTEASYQASSADLVNCLLVKGDDNSCAWVYDQASINAYGYREGTISVSGASTQQTLINAGNAWLSIRKQPRWSYTYQIGATDLGGAIIPLLPGEEPRPNCRPFIDFQVGDRILTMNGNDTEVQRLRLMSATWPSAQSASVNLTVNDFFAEREIEFDRRLTRLGG